MPHTLPLLAAALALSACQRDPHGATFGQHVASAFEECNPAEIRFLAGKHNFMTAFRNCGSNNFAHYAWSPEGTHLYFQLPGAAHIMDAGAEDKRTISIPAGAPSGPATWLSNHRVAFPVRPAATGEPSRLAVFDRSQPSLMHVPLHGLNDVRDLHPGRAAGEILLTAETNTAPRTVLRLDLDDGSFGPAFPWLEGPIDTFTYAAALDLVVIGRGEVVELLQGHDGEVVGRWSNATRGVLHPSGRWLALEYEGAPVSVFHQRAWDEGTEFSRARDEARAQRLRERLPAGYPTTITPPMIGVVDLVHNTRWEFTGFQGTRFQWYEARDYYASFILWGFEGKAMHRNVVLGNLAGRLARVGRGEEMLGVQRYVGDEDESTASAPSDEADSSTEPPAARIPDAASVQTQRRPSEADER